MGAPITEFLLEFVIRQGLQRIRLDLSILDELFEDFNDTILTETYGLDSIKTIKEYISKTEFHIVQGFPREETRLPCCSINILASDEQPSKAVMSDVIGTETETIEPKAFTSDFVPTAYNSTTGYITIPLAVDLSNVRSGQYFVDANDEEFTIYSVINETTRKMIGIATDADVDISDLCFVKGVIETVFLDKKQTPFLERILLGIHAHNDPKAAKYWYYVVLYILASSRDIFEAKNMQIHNTNVSDFNRVLEYLPEEWYTRFINLTFLTYLSWTGDQLSYAQGTENAVRVEKDKVVVPVSSLKSIVTTE